MMFMYRIGIIIIIMLITCSIGGIGNTENQIEFCNGNNLIDHESINEITNDYIIKYPILWYNGRCCS